MSDIQKPGQGEVPSEGVAVPAAPDNVHPTGEFENTKLGGFNPEQLSAPEDPSTLPDNMPPILKTVVPPVEHQYRHTDVSPDIETAQIKDRKWLKWVGGTAAVALLGTLAFMAGNKSDEDGESPTPTQTSAIETEEPGDTPETTPEQPTNQNLVDRGNGFMVPEMNPGRPSIPPEIKETNDPREALRQLAAVSAYVTNTGDYSYVEFYTVNPDSDLAHNLRDEYEGNVNRVRNEWGIPDYFLHIQAEPVSQDEPKLQSGETPVIEAKRAEIGFGGPVQEAHYESLEKNEWTLIEKTVTIDGRELTIWVAANISSPSFKELNDYSDLYTE